MSKPVAQRDAGADPASAQAPPARVLRQFRVLWRADTRQRHWLQQQAALGGTQLAALAEIRSKPGLGVNALASLLGVRQPSASNLVHTLCRRELVQRRPAGTDRRAVCLHTTRAGDALLALSPARAAGALEAAVRRLDPSQLVRLEQELAQLISGLGQPG